MKTKPTPYFTILHKQLVNYNILAGPLSVTVSNFQIIYAQLRRSGPQYLGSRRLRL